MAERPILKVAKLTIVGDQFRIEALASAFEVPAGAEVEVALLYDYEEGSRAREDVRLLFTANLEGATAPADEVVVNDRPVLHDRQYGVLSRRMRAPKDGVAAGRWRVEGLFEQGPWGFQFHEKEAHFSSSGVFLLRAK